jgi:hypothetical protein
MHKKGEDGNNMARNRDLEIKRDQEGICERKVPLISGGGACLTQR